MRRENMKSEKNVLKGTKKEIKAFYASQRSQVGLGRNLGTRDMKSGKSYDRNSEKARLRKELAD